jgi:hypothetical protein
MIVAIHQPHYLPWLRYVQKIARSDVFVLLDDAQYTKNGWQNRTRIKSAQGWMYLTVPVLGAFEKPIGEVRINNQERWRAKHWMALCTNYSKAPYFRQYRDVLEPLYQTAWDGLCEWNLATLSAVLTALGIRARLVRSSQLGVAGGGTERIVSICRALGATAYLSGDFAATNHLEADQFASSGIEVRLQGWHCPSYRQQYLAAGFIPDLSIVDLLFNEGEKALTALTDRAAPPPATVPMSTLGKVL